MAQALPGQHPAVVLRSHYTQLRTLLVIAMIAVVGLTIAVVALATDEGTTVVTADTAAPAAAVSGQAAQRSDGGPDETAVAAAVGSQPSSGPDESVTAAAISGR
jgi:hypothetical protein